MGRIEMRIINRMTMKKMHFGDSGNKRSESAHDRYKTGEKNGLGAVFGKKSVSLVNMLLIDRNFGVGNNFLSKEMTDPVVGSIPQNGGCKKQKQYEVNIKRA